MGMINDTCSNPKLDGSLKCRNCLIVTYKRKCLSLKK